MTDRIPYEVVDDDRVMRGADLIGWAFSLRNAELFARELNALQDAEQRAYERGLREGREAERADVVPSESERIALSAVIATAGLDASGGDLRMVAAWLARVDAAISCGAHVPIPQGDAPLSRSQERRLAAQRTSASDRLRRIAMLYDSWANGDEPEGAPSPRRTLLAIGEILAEVAPQGDASPKPCAMCHGHGRRVYAVIDGESESETCPGCAGESGGSDA